MMRAIKLLSVGACLAAVACHHVDPRPATDVVGQYNDAMALVRHGEWADAQTAFQRLQFDLATRDTLQARVRFYLAESYAGQGEYLTATREFRRVADDYPADALAPSALLRTGDCYSALWRRPELDPTYGQTALATYQELVGRYPESRAARIGAQRLHELQEKFAQKDYDTGLFYFRRGAYDSAILYFRNMIVQYASSTLMPDAYLRLAESYKAINYREELGEVCDHLRQQWGTRREVQQICGDRNSGR